MAEGMAEIVGWWQSLDLDALYVEQQQYDIIQYTLSSVISDKLQATAAIPAPTDLAASVIQTAGAAVYSAFEQRSNDAFENSPLAPQKGLVSWQTTFWALTAIALNTCIQDCGRVLKMEKDFSLMIRTSPIFCLVDSLIIFFQLIFYTITKGPKTAMQIVANSRDQHSVQIGNNISKPAQWLTRGIVLTLAIVQAIKLFALRGVPWSQAFGAFYLASYVFNGLLNVFGKEPPALSVENQALPQRRDVIPSTGLNSYAIIVALFAQIVLWTIATTPALPDVFLSEPNSGAEWCLAPVHLLTLIVFYPFLIARQFFFYTGPLVFDIIILMSPFVLVSFLISTQPFHNVPSILKGLSALFQAPADVVQTVILTLMGCLLFIIRICKWKVWIYVKVLQSKAPGETLDLVFRAWLITDPYLVTVSLIIFAASIGYCLARILFFGVLADKLGLRQLSVANHQGVACIFLFVANISLGLIYYSQVYDPQHTHKPGWVENLGRSVFLS